MSYGGGGGGGGGRDAIAGGGNGEDGTVEGEFSDAGGGAGGLPVDCGADFGWRDGLQAEALGGDDAVVEDVGDVGLRGEEAEGGCVVLRGGGLHGSDAEMLVALVEAGSDGCGAESGVCRDGGVAIENKVAMRHDGGRVDLGGGKRGEAEGDDEEAMQLKPEKVPAGGLVEREIDANGHGDTSLLR